MKRDVGVGVAGVAARLSYALDEPGEGEAPRDSGGGVFDWLLDALDALDDKIAEKVERAEDALFDAFEDVQDSFKKTFSFQKKKKHSEEEKSDDV